MKRSYYIYNNGSLRRKDNTLTFTDENDDKRDLPIEQINDIYVMSEMTFNTSLVNILSQYGIPVHFLPERTVGFWESFSPSGGALYRL